MPERLRRLEYAFQCVPIYFVTACTYKRQRILNNADVQARLIEFGRAGSDRGMAGRLCFDARSFPRIRDHRRRAAWPPDLDEIVEKFIIENTSSVESSIASLAKGIF